MGWNFEHLRAKIEPNTVGLSLRFGTVKSTLATVYD
jgi:hypothetical protein